MVNHELRSKLLNADSIEKVRELLSGTGEEYSPEEIERIWQEIEHHRPGGKRKLDEDEMDAVAGGGSVKDRNWYIDGCAATCEKESWCWSNDWCSCFEVTYAEFSANHWKCTDGGKHDYQQQGEYLHDIDRKTGNPIMRPIYVCTKCGKTRARDYREVN